MADDTDENKDTPETVTPYQMGDDLIATIRELVQLSILTGTNIVDHLRAIHVEVDPSSRKLIPTEQYVEAYNLMVEELVQKADEAQKEMERKSQEEAIDGEEVIAPAFLVSSDENQDVN